jgi:F0F1-type ATP synthase delta subunit
MPTLNSGKGRGGQRKKLDKRNRVLISLLAENNRLIHESNKKLDKAQKECPLWWQVACVKSSPYISKKKKTEMMKKAIKESIQEGRARQNFVEVMAELLG